MIAEYGSKTEEASIKIVQYDRLEADFVGVCKQRDELTAANTYLDQRVVQTSQVMAVLEKSRKGDAVELAKMRE